MWGALSDERTGLSFTTAAGPRQRSNSRARVAWDSRPYFTVSDSRLPFLSPPTTRRVTVEVFDSASTREQLNMNALPRRPKQSHHIDQVLCSHGHQTQTTSINTVS
jgi:hypothetical protein